MKNMLFVRLGTLILLASLFVISFQPASPVDAQDMANPIYLPVIAAPIEPYIVNHLNTDISVIPADAITAAKGLIIHYAHTSHGSQITTGLRWLEQLNPIYNVDIVESTTPQIPSDPTALRIYDGTAGDTYVEPGDYWEGAYGMGLTRQVVGTGWFDFSEWGWCGQVSYYSDAQINEYLSVMSGFEVDFPGTRFILMTGHTEDYLAGQTTQNNNIIRAYAASNDMILFDFADIEEYYPDGTPVPADQIDDSCPWCKSWCLDHNFCTAHPEYCQNFDQMGDCAHTHKLMCSLKAQAYWYMMARLAGWNP